LPEILSLVNIKNQPNDQKIILFVATFLE